MSRTRSVAAAALAAYTVLVGVALLEPTPLLAGWVVDGLTSFGTSVGVPQLFLYGPRPADEVNAAMVVPLVALAAVVWPRVPWTSWTAYAFAASLAVELFQGFLLSARTAQTADVVSNTAGALVGALAVQLVRVLSGAGRDDPGGVVPGRSVTNPRSSPDR